MARSHARLLASIWEDDDFLALPPGAQRMYMFLISQRDLQHCGVIGLRERRWSKRAAGLSVDDVRTELEVLAARRFVVIDDDAEELLVRSLIRRDKVYAQPNVFKAAADQIRAISSPQIRAVLLEELQRLPMEELKGEAKGVHGDLIAELSQLLGRGSPTPPPTPSGQVPSEPRGKGSGYGGEVEDSPSPDPLPVPPPAGAAAPALRVVEGWQPSTTDELIADWLDHVPKRPPGQVIGQVGKSVKTMLDEGIDPADVRRGIAAWVSKGLHPSSLPSVVNEVMNRPATPMGRDSPPRLVRSTTDERVAQAQALKARFAAAPPTLTGEITP